MIEAQHLSKTFTDPKRGTVNAVADITLNCKPGEIYGLLGPNGAGKTTLMRMMATILAPTDGTATVAGHDIKREPAEVRANIGYLSGSTALYERMTARDMVRYFGSLYGLPRTIVDERIRRIFNELEMNDFGDARCDKLSTGQKQRVSIARTIIHEPSVIIFDEPTNGLDILAARSIMRFIRGCREQGRTVIFSTHILSEVESLCDRIGVVYNGTLVAEGTMDELRRQTGKTTLQDVFLTLIGETE